MPVGKLILFGLLGLVVAEAAAFVIVVGVFGSFAALAALFGSSILGLAVLARMGRRLAGRVADILSHRDFGTARVRSGGFLTTVGGLLLVLPGFITDCVGLLLLIPAIQRRVIDRVPLGRAPPAGRVLDLDRSQWQNLPNRGSDRREAPPKMPPKRSRGR